MHTLVSPCYIPAAQPAWKVLGYAYLEIVLDYVCETFRKLRLTVSGSEATERNVRQDSTRFAVRLWVEIRC